MAVTPETSVQAELYRRREHKLPILYSKDTLGANDERSTSADWEVVSMVASPVENEPMDPVTVMRNMRGLAGGSQVNYTPTSA